VAFGPDSRHFVSAGSDGTLKVWDADTGLLIRSLTGHTNGIWSVAFSRDGLRVASAGDDRTVRMWDAATGHLIRTLAGSAPPVGGVAFSPDGRRLASAGADSTVKVWETATGQLIRTLRGHRGWVYSLTFSPDGGRLASVSEDRTVRVWDAVTGQEIHTFNVHPDRVETGALSITPDGRPVRDASYADRHVAFSPDGRQLASPSGLTVTVWDAASGREALTLKGHTGVVSSVAFSPDGRRLASASSDHTVRLWDIATGLETLTLKGHGGHVTSVAFSPDGRLLASADADGTIRVFDARDPTPELLVRDEARNLIVFLVERSAGEADLRDRIARDPTRTPAVRATALDMAHEAWSAGIIPRAEAVVGSLFARLLVRDDVLAELRARPAAAQEIQAASLKLAETWRESAMACNNAAWGLVRGAGRPDTIYRRGLHLAEAACRLEPNNGGCLNTLGIAQYRVGLVSEALASLTRSNTLNDNKEPADLALLAMARQRLGYPAEARALLDRLRHVLTERKGLDPIQVGEGRAFLTEAEAVILYDPKFPSDTFAP
jgi:DNA-binding beta-propeller fold protein YncE